MAQSSTDLRTRVDQIIERAAEEVLHASRQLAEGIDRESTRLVPPVSKDVERLVDQVFDFAEQVIRGQRRMVNDVIKQVNEQVDRAAKTGRGATKRATTRVSARRAAVGRKVTGRKVTGRKATGRKVTGRKATGRKATGKRGPAKRTSGTRAPAATRTTRRVGAEEPLHEGLTDEGRVGYSIGPSHRCHEGARHRCAPGRGLALVVATERLHADGGDPEARFPLRYVVIHGHRVGFRRGDGARPWSSSTAWPAARGAGSR